MRLHTIPDLLRAPEDDPELRLVVDALGALLGVNGPTDAEPIGEWRDSDREQQDDFETRTRSTWQLDPSRAASGTRADGLIVRAGTRAWMPGETLKTGPHDPPTWVLTFPSILGSQSPTRVLIAATLADAVDQIDAGYPMPDWWVTIRIGAAHQ